MTTDHSTSSQIEQLIQSFMDRQRRGEHPTVEDYAEKHPDLADQIREVFPALALMEEFGSAAGPDTGPYQPKDGDLGPMPAQLGDFRILREIGRGGMGVVYEAMQVSLGRHVALKVLPPQARANEVFRKRFIREAHAAGRLHHTNIVPVFGVGEHQAMLYYVMQHIQGQTLDAVLEEVRRFWRAEVPASGEGLSEVSRNLLTSWPSSGSLPVKEGGKGGTQSSSLQSSEFGRSQYYRNLALVGIEVAEALVYAHAQGVVHRDIKPSNLMLDVGGTVWVTDFGLAKVENTAELTGPGEMLGTLRYMAPEQLAGQADPRSDIYGLGITLYELATLRPAFDAAVRPQLIDSIRFRDPVPPSKIEPQVPRDLETIIQKATAKEPAHRYQTAADLAGDLRRFYEDRPDLARPVGPLEHGWRWCRRNPSLALALGAFLLTLLAGTATAVQLARLAWHRADLADSHALAAEVAAEDARRSEEKAKAAQEEAERTLIESLLQPVGHSEGPLGPHELAALEKLAGLSSDGVRMRFLRTGLGRAESARRLGIRAEPVIRAVVGLDRQRKKAVEGILLERLQEKNLPRDLQVACLALAAALPCENDRLADLGTRILMEQASRRNFVVREMLSPAGAIQQTVTFISQGNLERVLATANGLTGGLTPAQASAHAEALVAILGKKTAVEQTRDAPTIQADEVSIHHLAMLLRSVLHRLPADQAAKQANAAITVILTTARQGALMSRTFVGDGPRLERVNYHTRMRSVAEFVPWLSAEQVPAQARAVVAEMRRVANPEKGSYISNPMQAAEQLLAGLSPLLARLPANQAQTHASEAANLLLSLRKSKSPRLRGEILGQGVETLAAYLPATVAAPLADALGESLGDMADARQALTTSTALQGMLDRLPAEQARPRADSAAAHLVKILESAVAEEAKRGEKGPRQKMPRWGYRTPAEDRGPIASLAKQVGRHLARLAPERAGEHATGAARVLIPALLAAEETADSVSLAEAVRAVAEYLPAQEVVRHVEAATPKGGRFQLGRQDTSGLLIQVLGERLSARALITTLEGSSLSIAARRHLAGVLNRQAETAAGPAADQLVAMLLATPRFSDTTTFRPQGLRQEELRGVLKTLAARVPADKVAGHTSTIVERITKNPANNELLALTEGLDVLLGRLPAEKASEQAAKLAQVLVEGICKGQPRKILPSRVKGFGTAMPSMSQFATTLRMLSPRLSPPAASQHVEALLNAQSTASQVDDLCNQAWCVRALADRLPASEAENAVGRVAQPLLAGIGKASSATELAKFTTTLASVTDRFPVRLTEQHALAVMKWAEKTRRGYELPPLAEAYQVVLARLPADTAGKHAEALARHIVQAGAKTNSPLDLESLARSLQAVSGHLSAASKYPEQLAGRLFEVWDEAPEEILTEQIGGAIQAVASLLPAAAAGKSADRLLAVLKKANVSDRTVLTEVHEALIRRLPAEQARPRRLAAVLACVSQEAMGRSPEVRFRRFGETAARQTMPAYLAALVAACPPADLALVLRSPACTGDVQSWFLAELGGRWKGELRSVWDAARRAEREAAQPSRK